MVWVPPKETLKQDPSARLTWEVIPRNTTHEGGGEEEKERKAGKRITQQVTVWATDSQHARETHPP